ncbi:hypothetical protein CR513_32964, partial [Mucuna pruriens]
MDSYWTLVANSLLVTGFFPPSLTDDGGSIKFVLPSQLGMVSWMDPPLLFSKIRPNIPFDSIGKTLLFHDL